MVVDLETTGTRVGEAEITEIGAVKTRGGETLGEFSSLVRPSSAIPAQISLLTGITNSMVRDAPALSAVLPTFLEWARGAVLVAHNARFDVGFLKQGTARLDIEWNPTDVLDTVALARRVVGRDEVPNHKLATLARFFGAKTTPTHRALDDARATVDVLHGLLERLAPLGVTHMEDLATAAQRVPQARRAKRYLADGLPSTPGVYVFRDAQGQILYVGTTRNIRRRVRSYFTAAEKRRRINEMTQLAAKVEPIECSTVLEAQVRELRMISANRPAYNRRSRFPDRLWWLTLEREPRAVLRVLRSPRPPQGRWIGPYTSAKQAREAQSCLATQFSLPIRLTRSEDSPANVAACEEMMAGHTADFVAGCRARIRALAERQLYESAGHLKDQIDAALKGCSRAARLRVFSRIAQLTCARPDSQNNWDIAVIRYGYLAAACSAPAPRAVAAANAAELTAEFVAAPDDGFTASTLEEAELLMGWLAQPQSRLVSVQGDWACPRLEVFSTPDAASALACAPGEA